MRNVNKHSQEKHLQGQPRGAFIRTVKRSIYKNSDEERLEGQPRGAFIRTSTVNRSTDKDSQEEL